MTPPLTAEFAALLGSVRRPGDFFVAGTTDLLTPALEVAGVGPVALPLLPMQAQLLIAAAEPAPFGRGEQTIIDPAVRRCGQIGPDRVRLGGRHWAKTLEGMLTRVAEGLGVAEPIAAEFYKLLIYDQGCFFVGHRDTEKASGMFATLTVVLPSSFGGGELVVRHKGREARLDLRCQDPGEAVFAAFYADCVHEILPVTEGYRLALIYNLLRHTRSGRGRALMPPDYAAEQSSIAALLRTWRDREAGSGDAAPVKLVHLLDHAYTPAELGFASLKGADAAVAGVLTAAARDAACDLHLALLTIEESGAAEHAGGYGSRRGRWDDEEEEDDFEVGEVFERSVTLSHWRRADGEASVPGEIPVEESEISPPGACDKLAPDEEHFHEATGNEGASFERSYRRAALVLWPSDRAFAVLSQAGLAVTLPYLDALVRRSADSTPERRASLQHAAHDLAGHMLERWPKQARGPGDDRGQSQAGRMLALLTELDDAATIEQFLTEVTAAGGYAKHDNDAIIGALGRLSAQRRAVLVERIIAGTAAASPGACADLLARAASAWPGAPARNLAGAAARLLAALPGDPARTEPRAHWHGRSAVDAEVVVDLLTGLGAIEAGLAERATGHILARPQAYDLDATLIPAARQLFGAGATEATAAVERLRTACLAHLRARIAEPLAPPADWRRDSTLACHCRLCTDLARFLSDPDSKTWMLKAAEADRGHVEGTIKRAGCDIDTKTDRSGRPYRLVCTKNQASYERRAAQRKRDLDDVARLAG